MRKSNVLISTAHIVLGLLSICTGIAWLLLNFYDDRFMDERLPQYAYLVMLPEIICGFLIFLAGCFGFCFNKKSTFMALLYVTSNVFTMLVWAPLLVIAYSFTVMIMYGPDAHCGMEPCMPVDWDTYNLKYLLPEGEDWVYLFPTVGLATGFLDFTISICALINYCMMKEDKTKSNMYVTEPQ